MLVLCNGLFDATLLYEFDYFLFDGREFGEVYACESVDVVSEIIELLVVIFLNFSKLFLVFGFLDFPLCFLVL